MTYRDLQKKMVEDFIDEQLDQEIMLSVPVPHDTALGQQVEVDLTGDRPILRAYEVI